MGKICIHFFSLQLRINDREHWVLQPWLGYQSIKTVFFKIEKSESLFIIWDFTPYNYSDTVLQANIWQLHIAYTNTYKGYKTSPKPKQHFRFIN